MVGQNPKADQKLIVFHLGRKAGRKLMVVGS